jgi:hypothetical protein
MSKKYTKKSSSKRHHKKRLVSKRTKRSTRNHRGGSPASDRVMSFATGASVQSETPGTPRLTADPTGLNLYQTTGGAKRSKSRSSSSRKSRRSHNRRQMKKRGGGGATDFRDTLYSRSVDGRSDEVPFFNAFTSEKYISPQELINEPNMVANPPYLQ